MNSENRNARNTRNTQSGQNTQNGQHTENSQHSQNTRSLQAGLPNAAALRATLAQRQTELEAEINRKRAEVRRDRIGFDSSTSTDGGDGAQIDAIGSVHHAEIERDMAELRDISAALARIDTGAYGICADCGEQIVAARLAIWPTAKRCTPCQRQLERGRSSTSSI